MEFSEISCFNKLIFVYIKKKFAHMYVKAYGRREGLKVLADM